MRIGMRLGLIGLLTAGVLVARAEPAAPDPAATQTRQPTTAELFGEVRGLWQTTGLYGFFSRTDPELADAEEPTDKASGLLPWGVSQAVMIVVCLIFMYLAVFKRFEPLLLLPIGFGGLLSNLPFSGINSAPLYDAAGQMLQPGGFLWYVFSGGIETAIFPILIFMGVGAMTDFGPLIANPRTALLGAAAQFGIFSALIGAVLLNDFVPGIQYSIREAASIGIIGGADGPTAIWLTSKLAPDLLGAIAVAAYSYMALVPIIQPPIMRALTGEAERKIHMKQLRHVSKLEKVVFPVTVVLLCGLLLPSAVTLVGALMLGNLARECGVVNRLSDTMANALINIVTILLGLAVGSKLAAHAFLTGQTLGIIVLGLFAFSIGTATGVLMAKLMNVFLKEKLNPLIGAAGVSAVPMAARVANKVGMEADSGNVLLMHAMGPNVAGVIGSAVAAGILYRLCVGL